MKQRLLILISVVTLCLLGVAGYGFIKSFGWGSNTVPNAARTLSSPNEQITHKLDHVVIIVEENKPNGSIIGNPEASFINQLARSGARGSQYYGVTHPSLPNYVALTSGTTAGITSDCNPPGAACEANVTNIADRLESAGKSWRMYAESMPAACYENNSGRYAVKHNPFMYYPDIRNNHDRCNQHVVAYAQLDAELQSKSGLPDYVFIAPDLCSDTHDCSIKTGDDWLAREVPKIMNTSSFRDSNSLLVLTWDEGNKTTNNVPVIFAGPAAKQNYVSNNSYSHYSLLHTIEWAWNLDPLTDNDKQAVLMNGMLR